MPEALRLASDCSSAARQIEMRRRAIGIDRQRKQELTGIDDGAVQRARRGAAAAWPARVAGHHDPAARRRGRGARRASGSPAWNGGDEWTGNAS